MSDELSRLTREAANALEYRRLRTALGLFERANALTTPAPPAVANGLRETQELLRRSDELRELVAQGQQQMANGAYNEAAASFEQALALALAHRLLSYQPELEPLRDQARALDAYDRDVRHIEADLAAHADPDSISQQIDALLNRIPHSDAYNGLVFRIERCRDTLDRGRSAEDLLVRARAAFSSADFRNARRLADLIPLQTDKNAIDIQLVQESASDELNVIDPALYEVGQLRRSKRWADALRVLGPLRDLHPCCPDFQRAWRDACVEWGDELSASALSAAQQLPPDFKNGGQVASQAQAAFARALELATLDKCDTIVNLDHARRRVDDADVAARLIDALEEAQRERGESHYAAALGALDRALAILDQARGTGRQFSVLEGLVGWAYQEARSTMDRIDEEQAAIAEVRRQLLARRLGQAQSLIDALLKEKMLPETRAEANQLLAEVDARLQDFRRAVSGAASASPASRAELLKLAFDVWPEGTSDERPIQDALIAALFDAGIAARDSRSEREAASFFERVLQLDPNHLAARRELEGLGVRSRVQGTFETIRAELAQALREPPVPVRPLEALRDRVAELEPQARRASIADEFNKLRREVDDALQRWSAFAENYAAAQTHRLAGEWQEALARLRAAFAAMDGQLSPKQVQEKRDYTQVIEAAERLAANGPALLAKAREHYGGAAQAQQPAAEIALAQQLLTQIETDGARLRALADESGGPPPAASEALIAEAADLNTFVTIAHTALENDQLDEAIGQLRAAALYRDDAVLAALIAYLEAKLRGQLEALGGELRQAEQSGDATRQLALLRRITALTPDDGETQRRLKRFEQRLELESALSQFTSSARRKLASGSLPDARSDFRSALDLLLRGDIELPGNVRALVNQILALANEREATGLGYDDLYDQARQRLGELSSLATSQDSWGARRLDEVATEWAGVERQVAISGVIASTIELRDWINGLRAAGAALRRDPGSEKAIRDLTEISQSAGTAYRTAADRRLSRIAQAMSGGDFVNAQADLDSIVNDVYGPLAEALPGFLDNDENYAEVQAQVEKHRREVAALRELNDRLAPALVAARQFLANGQFDEIEKALRPFTPEELASLPRLQEQVVALQKQVADGRVEAARGALNELLFKAETALATNEPPNHLKTLVAALEQLPTAQLQLLSDTDRQARNAGLLRLKERIASADDIAAKEDDYQSHIAQGRYAQALDDIQEILKHTFDTAQRRVWETRRRAIGELDPHAQAIIRFRADLAKAFSESNYNLARSLLADAIEQAVQLKAEAERLGFSPPSTLASHLQTFEQQQTIASVGIKYLRAEQEWKTSKNPDAMTLIGEAASRIAGIKGILAEELAERIEASRSQIERDLRREQQQQQAQAQASAAAQERQQKLAYHTSEAQMAFAKPDFSAAEHHAHELIKLDPQSADASQLLARIKEQRQFQETLAQARKAFDAGSLDRTIIDALLKMQPGDFDAIRLSNEIDAARGQREQADLARTNEQAARARRAALVADARHHASQAAFQQARATLKEARDQGLDVQAVADVNQFIAERENEWRAQFAQPIEQLFAEGGLLDGLNAAAAALADPRAELLHAPLLKAARAARPAFEHTIDTAASADDLDGLAEALGVVNLPDQAPNELRTMRRELQVRAMLRSIKLLIDEANAVLAAQPEQAEELASRARQVAEQLGPIPEATSQRNAARALVIRAQTGKDERQKQQQRQEQADVATRRRAERNNLVAAARAALADAQSEAALRRALKLANDAAAIPGYEQDTELESLTQQIGQSLEHWALTIETLENSTSELEDQQYDRAVEQLTTIDARVPQPLRPAYAQRLTVAQHLAQAKRASQLKDWAEALAAYEAAVAADGRLLRLVERDMFRCRAQLTTRLVNEAAPLLDAQPPRADEAQALFAEALKGSWLDRANPSVGALEQRIAALKELQEAIALLDQGQYAAALKRLASARASADAIDMYRVEQWFELANAWDQARRGSAEAARAALQRLDAPLAESPLAIALRNQLASLKQNEQRFSDAGASVTKALASNPPDLAAAVDEARALYNDLPQDARVPPLIERVDHELRVSVDQHRRSGDYAAALAAADLRIRLLPDATAARQQSDQVATERAQTYATLLASADESLHSDAIDSARSLYQQAEKVNAQRPDPRLEALGKRLAERAAVVASVDAGLADANRMIAERMWPEAAELVRKARADAPNYPPVAGVVARLHERLAAEVRNRFEHERFKDALAFFDLNLPLPLSAELAALRATVTQARAERLQHWRERAQAALRVWALDTAADGISHGRQIDADDPALHAAERRLAELQAASDDVRIQMEAGWREVEAGSFSDAALCFARAAGRAAAQPLPEAEHWAAYARLCDEATRVIEEVGREPRARQTSFSQAAPLLSEAAQWLSNEGDYEPPSILGDRAALRIRRARARAHATQLVEIASHLGELHQAMIQQIDTRSWTAARATLNEIGAGLTRYRQMLHNILVAPADGVETKPLADTPPDAALLNGEQPLKQRFIPATSPLDADDEQPRTHLNPPPADANEDA